MRRARSLPAWVTLVATIGVVGVAAAWWSGAGSGTASGTTATPAAVTLSPGTPASQLYPGGQSDVSLTITNTNLFSVRIGSLSRDAGQGTGGFSVDGLHAGCAVAALTFTTQTTGWTVPAKVGVTDGVLAVSLAGALAMSDTADSACQGATFAVYLVAGL